MPPPLSAYVLPTPRCDHFCRLRPSLALLQFLEPELIVFLYFPHLLLHLQKLEVQFFDLARKLPDLFFQLADTRIAGLSHQNRCIA